MTSFVYQLTFPNGMMYFGVSNDPDYRFKQHCYDAKKGSLFPVHKAMRKYGSQNIDMRIVARGKRDIMLARECALIEKHDGDLYNVSPGGDAVSCCIGRKLSAEHRKKISEAHKGRKHNPEWIARRTVNRIGKKRTLEQRQRMSEGQKRRIRKPEEIERMREYARTKVVTAEYRENIKQAALKRWARVRETA